MRQLVIAFGAGAIVAGFIAGLALDETFSYFWAFVGGINLSYFLYRKQKQRQEAARIHAARLPPEIRAVFDRLTGTGTEPSSETGVPPESAIDGSPEPHSTNQLFSQNVGRYEIAKTDMQPLAVISAFAWKHAGLTPSRAVEYAMQTIYLSRNGTPEQKKDADVSWQSAIRWSIDTGTQSYFWGIECLKRASGG